MRVSFLFVLLLLTLLCRGQVQEPSSPADTAINTWELNHDAREAWKTIDSVWMSEVYWNVLKKHKIKMTCAHCEKVMMHVDLKIDSTGKLTDYKVEKSMQCGSSFSPEMEEEFLNFFKALDYPQALRNLRIHAMLGTGLKC